MQIQQACDPHLRACSMKVRVETPKQAMAMAPSRSLPRSASELGDPPSPFSSNPSHHPVSMPTTPAATSSSSASSSFGCIAGKPPPPTDSPPPTPTGRAPKPKPLTPAAAAAAYYASLWSPRRLMQRAARAFRSSRSRRVRGNHYYAAGEEHAGSVTGKVSDVACAVSVGAGGGAATDLAGSDNGRGGAAPGAQEEEEHHEVVPEKIIHEMNHHAPPVVAPADECETKTAATEEMETTAADADAAEEVESPKKGAAPAPAPEAAPEAAAEDVADKFVTVVKEAIKKQHEAGQEDEKKEATKQRFQGSRVRTAMEARPESEQPRRREVARSNDAIEEARSKLLEKRQFSRVRALVGAFETVMDEAKKEAAATPRHLHRQSA